MDSLVIGLAQPATMDAQDDRGCARLIHGFAHGLLAIGSLLATTAWVTAEDLEPRRWSHTPIGLNSLGLGYVYSQSDILFDPALRLENVEMELHGWGLKYLHAFELLGRTARVEATMGYAAGRWTGLVDGVPGAVERDGLTDSQLRFAVNLVGAPPLAGKEYQEYRAQPGLETIVGAALIVHLPTGDYQADKLLNIGTNRFTIRPQLGVLHNWDHWSLEYTGSVWLFTDNDDFYDGSTLAQGPLSSLQTHVVYSVNRGVWVGASGAYTYATESSLNGAGLDDARAHLWWSLGAGFPVAPYLLVKCAYVGSRALDATGVDSDGLVLGLGYLW